MKKSTLFCLVIITSLTHAQVNTQVVGCTDELATNYNSVASQNDGSCLYSSAPIVPETSWTLPSTLVETSGIIMWNNSFWTHNDNSDLNIYSFDTANTNSCQY